MYVNITCTSIYIYILLRELYIIVNGVLLTAVGVEFKNRILDDSRFIGKSFYYLQIIIVIVQYFCNEYFMQCYCIHVGSDKGVWSDTSL